MTGFLPNFTRRDIGTPGARIHLATAGQGPPLLLLHGHPQTHLTWHKVAPALAERFTVVAPDLRGYGDSAKPEGGPNHIAYSKRAMAADQLAVMRALGHERFAVVGHDRGGRVAHRLALDHPDAVSKIAVLDIAPTATMYAKTNQEFATRYFWWFFLIQPFPLPERLIDADPEFFLRTHLDAQSKTPGATSDALFAEYLRCYRDPASRHAICEDYRAAATIDLEHDAADSDKRIEVPLLALWGAKGTVGALYDVLETWREKSHQRQRSSPGLRPHAPGRTARKNCSKRWQTFSSRTHQTDKSFLLLFFKKKAFLEASTSFLKKRSKKLLKALRGGRYPFGTESKSASHTTADPSDGARQSPRGDSEPPDDTFGPFGIADRLNWLKPKKRRTNTANQPLISPSAYCLRRSGGKPEGQPPSATSRHACQAKNAIFDGRNP